MSVVPVRPQPDRRAPVGLFDSGVGGLSVWREVVRQHPAESTVYFADQAHVPYGPRSAHELRAFALAITERLVGDAGCKAVVVACNTASAAALDALRARFDDTPIVGMEPAVKPAAERTRTKVVGILATPATFQGALFRATAGRHASDVRVIEQVCPGLADAVEAGRVSHPDTEAMLRGFLAPIVAAGADTLVLACTHYPFVIDTIRRIVGPRVEVIDPAPAVARQLGRRLEAADLHADPGAPGGHRFVSSGDPAAMRACLRALVSVDVDVEAGRWSAPSAARPVRAALPSP
jgi:glutamate racemase